MLTAFLKILELVIAVARKTPDQKRQQLAKDLLKIYGDIDDVVLRGRKLIALFETQNVVANATIEALLKQQAALQSLAIHLSEIEPLLQIHVPRTATLHVAMQIKGEEIVFILDWLLNRPDPQRDPEMPLPAGYSEMTPIVRRLVLSKHLSPVELALEELRTDPLDPWELFYQQPINAYEWSDEQLQHPTILVATSSDLRKAQDTLNGMAAIGEELRLFLIEKFRPEDLL